MGRDEDVIIVVVLGVAEVPILSKITFEIYLTVKAPLPFLAEDAEEVL